MNTDDENYDFGDPLHGQNRQPPQKKGPLPPISKDIEAAISMYSTAKMLDELLYYLAQYHETHGLTKRVTEIAINQRFVEFKTRILKKSITLNQLTKDVMDQYGLLDHSAMTPQASIMEQFNNVQHPNDVKQDMPKKGKLGF